MLVTGLLAPVESCLLNVRGLRRGQGAITEETLLIIRARAGELSLSRRALFRKRRRRDGDDTASSRRRRVPALLGGWLRCGGHADPRTGPPLFPPRVKRGMGTEEEPATTQEIINRAEQMDLKDLQKLLFVSDHLKSGPT